MIKTLFLGSNFEALETLKFLNAQKDFKVKGVVTQPDKPIGRYKEVKETLVKEYALNHNIEVFYTNNEEYKYREILDYLQPELIVCKSFGEIIPNFALKYPKYGAINIHFSLLPKYRGAVPIQKAILDGEKKTGISITKMGPNLDEGDILAQQEIDILPNDTNESLRKKLVKKAPSLLIQTLRKWINNEITPIKQNSSQATYCWKSDISKEKAQIFWKEYTADYIDRLVRAFIPWPVAWTVINGKKVKIFEVEIIREEPLRPGDFGYDQKNLLIGTRDGVINVKKLQVEGKKAMNTSEFLKGTKVVSIQ